MAIQLQLPSDGHSQPYDLQTTIQQIISQKGAFRHVTEKSIVDEIPSSDDEDGATRSDVVEDDGTNQNDDTPQNRLDKLWKSREEMLQHLGRAQNEVLTMLDSLSLLLSKHSAPAQHSMSPALKQLVPTGSIEARVVEQQASTKTGNQNLDHTSHGWRSQAFQLSFENLSSAADRLRIEAERESKYWAEVSNLDQHGWQVSRHPRNSKAIGVHLGFAESAPQFRNQGFALLRQDESSNVYIDQDNTLKRTKTVKVSIRRNNIETGYYAPLNLAFSDESKLNNSLTQARNSLFEKELFYELSREARAIAGYGVDVRTSNISFNVEDKFDVSLSFDDQSYEQRISTASEQDNDLAHFVGMSLCHNLLKAHERILVRRSQSPLPMSLKPVEEPEYSLLRPVAVSLRHSHVVKQMQHQIQSILRPLRNADIRIESTLSYGHSSNLPVDELLPEDSTLKPAESLVQINLPSGRAFEVRITTFLGPPVYGTIYTTSDLDYDFMKLQSLRQNCFDDVVDMVSRIIRFDLTSIVATKTAGDTHTGAIWTASRPQIGELTLSIKGKAVRKMKLDVAQSSFSLKVQSLEDSRTNKKMAWIWTGSEMSTFGDTNKLEAESKSFMAVVEQTTDLQSI